MSTLRVNKITNVNDDGPIEFTKGAILSQNQQITPESIKINSVGVMTASVFYGRGENVVNIGGGISKSKSLALTFIL